MQTSQQIIEALLEQFEILTANKISIDYRVGAKPMKSGKTAVDVYLKGKGTTTRVLNLEVLDTSKIYDDILISLIKFLAYYPPVKK